MTETALEAVGPATEPIGCWNKLSLVFLVGDDLGELSLNVLRLGGLASESAESRSSFLDVSSLDEISWRVWQEQQTASEDGSPNELNANGNSVRAGVGSVLCAIHDAGSKQETDSDTELVSSNQSTSNLLGALGKISIHR